ncbi:50S ribosomal protein L32 [Fontivita pretiosa]|uniref:50S ribosomal protein L32 n=1 Tax=Fontivita pretiosa TaxID=2989684 RepID=UPI003D184D04
MGVGLLLVVPHATLPGSLLGPGVSAAARDVCVDSFANQLYPHQPRAARVAADVVQGCCGGSTAGRSRLGSRTRPAACCCSTRSCTSAGVGFSVLNSRSSRSQRKYLAATSRNCPSCGRYWYAHRVCASISMM